jgi:RNA polymerase sigma-70 factor (ECF subfamily)
MDERLLSRRHLFGGGVQIVSGDQALISAAVRGDAEAFAQIMAANHEDMARLAMLITRDPEAARDAVQEAWPVVWRKLGTLRDPARLRPWLMSIAANRARQLIRADRRRRAREQEASRLSPAEAETAFDPNDNTERFDLARVLGRLSADERELVGLRYIAELTSGEIADLHGTTASAVRGRLKRILARLREDLGDA